MGDDTGSKNTKAERNWAMACHLAALAMFLKIPFGNVLGRRVGGTQVCACPSGGDRLGRAFRRHGADGPAQKDGRQEKSSRAWLHRSCFEKLSGSCEVARYTCESRSRRWGVRGRELRVEMATLAG